MEKWIYSFTPRPLYPQGKGPGYAFDIGGTYRLHLQGRKILERGTSVSRWLYRPIARQRLGKQIPAGANARNDRTPTARQGISKHA
jgi:hypothetical protein